MTAQIGRMPWHRTHRGVAQTPGRACRISPLIDGENGPWMTSAPRCCSQSSAARVSAPHDLDVVNGIETSRIGSARRRRGGSFVVDLRQNASDQACHSCGRARSCDSTSLKCGLSLCANMVQRSTSSGGAKPGCPYRGAGEAGKKRESFAGPSAGMISILSAFPLIGLALFCRARASRRGPGPRIEQSASWSGAGGRKVRQAENWRRRQPVALSERAGASRRVRRFAKSSVTPLISASVCMAEMKKRRRG